MSIEKLIFTNQKPEDPYAVDLDEALKRWADQVNQVLNGGFRIDQDANVQIKTVTTNAVADTEDAVPHNLGRVPEGYIVIRKDKAADIYDGSTAFTATNIYIRSEVVSVTAKILIF